MIPIMRVIAHNRAAEIGVLVLDRFRGAGKPHVTRTPRVFCQCGEWATDPTPSGVIQRGTMAHRDIASADRWTSSDLRPRSPFDLRGRTGAWSSIWHV